MSRLISRAEGFETVYEAFQQVNFSAFDYDTIKESLLDYIKLYFPEDFNDYIESSEFIAILEMFAYISELLAYRADINAHENFLTTAQRKQNILRLAKLISYNATRNLPARGLVKITSVNTTETVFDPDGVNLANRTITWNDQSNPKWKEQFLLVIDRILEQDFGSVAPDDRVQVDDVLFELYQFNNIVGSLSNGVSPYTINVTGQQVGMELVPVELDENGPYERRPDNEAVFSTVYGSDGLGDASDTTGFFLLSKQGTLQTLDSTFDGITPNQTYEIDIENINDIDVWVNNIDPDTRETLEEWEQVDIAHAQNIIFNTNTNRKKFEVESLEDDQIRIIFGDGEFSDIPSGTLEFWIRTSLNQDIVIPRNTVNNQLATFTYTDDDGNTQSLVITFSLISTLQNASASEDIEHIRRVAPAVYYSQDRMVNARDYNTFMLQDPSILKMRAVNRTFAGESKYITWNDPSDTYRNVKVFGDDGALFYDVNKVALDYVGYTAEAIVSLVLEPALSNINIHNTLSLLPEYNVTRVFTAAEQAALEAAIQDVIDNIVTETYIHHQNVGSDWWVTSSTEEIETVFIVERINATTLRVIEKQTTFIMESPVTEFWNTNDGEAILTYDSLNTNSDRVVIIQSNVDSDRTGILSQNINLESLDTIEYTSGADIGLPNIHQLEVVTEDGNNDFLPDDYLLEEVFDRTVSVTPSFSGEVIDFAGFNVPEYVIDFEDFDVYDVTVPSAPVKLIRGVDYEEVIDLAGTPPAATDHRSTFIKFNTTANLDVVFYDFVYFYRESVLDDWTIVEADSIVKESFAEDVVTHDPYEKDEGDNYRRLRGRDSLNFLWTHFSSRYNLIDPSATNIIDMFIIPKAYYSNLKSWLQGTSTIEPEEPTSYELRSDYATLLENKMISDTVILHPGKIKILFGQHAPAELQAEFVVVRAPERTLTDNQIKVKIINVVRNFFDITTWEFGETFYFTELAAAIQNELPTDIDSVVLVPIQSQNVFGDLFQVNAREDEIFQPSISVDDIEMVDSLNSVNMKQCQE